ncbi:MAG TPA: methyltransferase domain-containing protein [Phycisphaerales bacterium]|nr:methyltransferase domain-containing protein [Phycisphaerales bacterium]
MNAREPSPSIAEMWEFLPHDPARSAAQIEGVRALLHANTPQTVLDLGCGTGRLLTPLAQAGHRVIGIDASQGAVNACREASPSATLIQGDFLAEPWPLPAHGADAILCLGNTFMTIADLDAAIALLSRVAASLAPCGVFLLDDLPHDLWPEVTEGNWQSGVSEHPDEEDTLMQMVWHPHDSVFTIRTGDRVDETCWTLTPDDRLLRLWTSSALALAARLAGLSEPEHDESHGLLVFRTMKRDT